MTYRNEYVKDIKKIVVKIGTTSINQDNGRLSKDFLDSIASQIATLHHLGKQVVIVSSGSIGLGVDILELEHKPREIPVRQAAAAVGQAVLMQQWSKAFEKYNLKVAQLLLTYDSFSNRLTYLNLRNSMNTLLNYGVIPIINENDPISVHEIEATFGDNDKLSAMVASKTEADILIILSDVDGLYDKNPHCNENANFIHCVEEITPQIESYGGNPTSFKGVGGMRTKIRAAKICALSGCHTIIASSKQKDILLRLINGEEIGTIFIGNGETYKNRIRWIILSKSNGVLKVDEGAKNAIINRMSLLPSGIYEVLGHFNRGDIVEIKSNEKVFAKGITDYSSEELEQIKGQQTDAIVDILGYKNYNHVIKKENIGLF